jgi:hypothetical protein
MTRNTYKYHLNVKKIQFKIKLQNGQETMKALPFSPKSIAFSTQGLSFVLQSLNCAQHLRQSVCKIKHQSHLKCLLSSISTKSSSCKHGHVEGEWMILKAIRAES